MGSGSVNERPPRQDGCTVDLGFERLARRLLRCSNHVTANADSMPQDPGFTEDQKQYLEGFIAGIAKKHGIAVPNGAAVLAPPGDAPAGLVYSGGT